MAAFEEFRALAVRPAEVELALLFHDAVLDQHRYDNEQQSADLARAVLSLNGARRQAVKGVCDLILATRHHGGVLTGDAALVADLDLWILAAPRSRFAEYETQVRAEYTEIPEYVFWDKRRGLLEQFLARECIYRTPSLRERWEATARDNLAWSIQQSKLVPVVSRSQAEREGFVLAGFVSGGEELRAAGFVRGSILLVQQSEAELPAAVGYAIFVKPERINTELWSQIAAAWAPKPRSDNPRG
ncbi:hypothetical protein [Herbaspirillum huttiense]|uniref:HD domain-containing protein n=1 Tax=Herbaspirillum huttiense TaxID=863372 RepID=UPI0039B02C57